jgi:hypothetical protein
LLALCLLACAGAQTLRIPVSDADRQWAEAEANIIVDAVASNDFKTAFLRTDGLCLRFPDAPHGYMMSVFARSIYVNCYRTKTQRLKVLEDAKRVEETTTRLLKLTPGDKNLKFYLGGALGYRGMLEMMEGSYFSALATGIKAVGALQDAVKTEPPIYDAYFGLAIFHFTRYVYSKILPWLAAGRDDQARAYEFLDRVLAHGNFCRHEALFRSFVFAMADRKWDGLEARMLSTVRRFPENIYLRYRLLDYYTTREQWTSVIPLARETHGLLSREPGSGVSAYFLVNAHLVNALARMGERTQAETLIRAMEQDQGNLEPWVDNPRMLELLRRAKEVLRRSR